MQISPARESTDNEVQVKMQIKRKVTVARGWDARGVERWY
jgi:hypothetical protein